MLPPVEGVLPPKSSRWPLKLTCSEQPRANLPLDQVNGNAVLLAVQARNPEYFHLSPFLPQMSSLLLALLAPPPKLSPGILTVPAASTLVQTTSDSHGITAAAPSLGFSPNPFSRQLVSKT